MTSAPLRKKQHRAQIRILYGQQDSLDSQQNRSQQKQLPTLSSQKGVLLVILIAYIDNF